MSEVCYLSVDKLLKLKP